MYKFSENMGGNVNFSEIGGKCVHFAKIGESYKFRVNDYKRKRSFRKCLIGFQTCSENRGVSF